MMRLWQLVSEAQTAQSKIISRLQKKHGKLHTKSQQQVELEQNQFMIYEQKNTSLKVDQNHMPNDPIQYTFQNSHKDVLDLQENCQLTQQSESLQKIQFIQNIFTQSAKQVQVTLNYEEFSSCDFAGLIQKIQQNQRRKLNQKGIQKIIQSLKYKAQIDKSIYSTIRQDKSYCSNQQNKPQMKTRRKKDQLKKFQKQKTSKGNKQNNNSKIGISGYQGLNRVRRNNQSSNILKTRRQNKFYAS